MDIYTFSRNSFRYIFFRQCVIVVLFTALFSSCRKDHLTQEKINERMVLVYVSANNDLNYDAVNSVRKMIEGAKNISNGVLLIYLKTQNSSSLIRVKPTKSHDVVVDTIEKYILGNSTDPIFLRRVIDDARRAEPAKSYGLILWSHATSWAPPATISTKSFGSDDWMEMDIKDLKEALPNDLYYIMFDACSMASMEVLYELKDKSKYILASPAEVLSSSFPYDLIMPELFKDSSALKIVATKFIEYYKSQSGMYASATVSLVNTHKLNTVASLIKALLRQKKPVPGYNLSKIQSLDFQRDGGVPASDLISFLENNYSLSEYMSIKNAIDDAVLTRGHTANFFNEPIKSYCGISIYLPSTNDGFRDYYNTLGWASAGGWNSLF